MTLEFKWTVSRGRDTYGYNICTLYADGQKVARCNGGGYDMEGTCLGAFIARRFAARLLTLNREFYGLTYHDPDFNPGKAVIGKDCQDRTLSEKSNEGQTVEQREKAGDSFGLERYQAFYSASSKVPTARHKIPLIDGACGISSVQKIGNAIGLGFEYVRVRSKKLTLYKMTESELAHV